MISWLFGKISGLYVRVRYPSVPGELRAFYKYTVLYQLNQLKYIWRDYVVRKPYKEIDFSGEFGAELLYVLPFAYWHHLNGTLKSTTSDPNMGEMYYFSPHHEGTHLARSDEGNHNPEIPRVLYSQDYEIHKWAPVPLKARYRNAVFVFDKPILIVANRYNSEWDGPPVSFLSLEILDFIFTQLKPHYTIVYNRPQSHVTADNSEVYDLGEFEWMSREHPEVVLMRDLYAENRGNARNFNHHQMMVYANADKFISTHGGTGTFASYFGGTNLLLSKKGPEHHFGCFGKIFPKFSGATILHAKTDEELKDYVRTHFLNH